MHRSQLGARDGTLVWMVGSPATGLGSLLVDSDTPASAALRLRWRADAIGPEVVGTAGDRDPSPGDHRQGPHGDNADFIGSDVDEGIGPPADDQFADDDRRRP
jgi:hypothetical protein